ncbi:MAG: M28 family peptidase, partial [Cyclobacteriaceae bacterium]|nr:M28 family peptidase [Cyclobacteriaceae bacterium]
MRIIFFLAFLLSVTAIKAQYQSEAEKYVDLISKEGLYDKLSILASDALEGRETGERGQKMAAAFIQNHFESLGLRPTVPDKSDSIFQQQLSLYSTVPGNTYIKINGVKKSNFDQIIYMSNDFSKEETSVELIFIGFGSDLVINKSDIFGKAAVFISSKDEPINPIVEKLKSAGAKIVLAVNKTDQTEFESFKEKSKNVFIKGKLKLKIPELNEQMEQTGLFYIDPNMAGEMFDTSFDILKSEADRMEEGKRLKKKLKAAQFSYQTESKIRTVLSENVLGYLEGSDKKDELLIITAHYDHIGRRGELINNGADDDASGTSSVMQLAEAFVEASKSGNRPRRSILFMTVTGEEKGLLGSEYYANNPIFPLENTVANLNIDMIGRIDPEHEEAGDYVYLVGSDKLSSQLHEISEKANASYTKMELDYTYNDESHPSRIYYRSDHWNFAKNNIPIIFYFNGVHEDYHKPTDTIEKINFDILAK